MSRELFCNRNVWKTQCGDRAGKDEAPVSQEFHVWILNVQHLNFFFFLPLPGPQNDHNRQKARRELLLHQLVQDTSPAEDLSVFWGSVVSSVTLHRGFILHLPRWFSLIPISTHSLQVWCCLLLLRHEHETNWLWAQHVSLPVCLWHH